MDEETAKQLASMEASRRREREVLESLLAEQTAERRKDRRGRAFFRWFLMIYLTILLVAGFSQHWEDVLDEEAGQHTAMVRLEGVIAADSEASADSINRGLRKAFADANTAAVILLIDSPGGSPVQSARIYDEIERLTKKYPKIPLYAVLDDLCASGGYYVAAAAKEIYASRATMVGSIGVVYQGFGLTQAIEKLGVESRILTAGKHKAFLNPFEAMDEEERRHLQGLLVRIHGQFIDAVKSGRGERLKGRSEDLFSGLIWTGEEAIELGLVDHLGDARKVARDVVKVEKIKDFTEKPDFVDRLAEKLGTSSARLLAEELRPRLQ